MTVRLADFTTGTYTGISPVNVSASGGYAQTTGGVLVPFAANTLRQTNAGLLVEPAATNLAKYSQQLSNSGQWGASGSATTVDATVAPDGTTTAELFNEGSGNAGFNNNSVGISAGPAPTLVSLYVKRNTAGKQFYIQNNMNDANGTFTFTVEYFNLDTVAYGGHEGDTVNITGQRIEALANGWFRISLEYAGTGGTAPATIRLFPGACNAVVNGRALATGSSMYMWQPDVVANPVSLVPLSPILTTSAAATRSADAVSFTVPSGCTLLTFTFDDASTQTATVTPGATHTISTGFSRRYIKYIDSNAAGGGATYSKAVSGSGVGLNSLQRAASVIKPFTGVGLVSLQRSIALRKSFTGVGVASLSTLKAKSIAVTAVGMGLVTLARYISVIKRMTGTGIASMSRLMALGRAITGSGTGAATLAMIKARGVAISATGIGLLSVATLKAKSIAVAAIGTGQAATAKVIAVTKTMTGIGVASLSRSMALGRAISASGTGSVGLVMSKAKSVAIWGTGIGLLSLSSLKAKSITLTATGIGIASVNRLIAAGRTIAGTGIGLTTINLGKVVRRTVSTLGTGLVTLATLKAKSIAVSALGVGSFSIRRGVSKTFAFAGAGVATLGKAVPLRITASGIGTALLSYLRPSAAASTERIIKISAEDRTRTIAAEDRTNIIPGEF